MSESPDPSLIRKQYTGEESWTAFISILLKFPDVKIRIPETLVFGWAAKKPTVLYSDESCLLKISKDVSFGFITTFLEFCPKQGEFPICIGRQTSTFVVQDSQAAMTIWHKSLSLYKPVFLQRYIPQNGLFSSLVRVVWKPDNLHFTFLTNKFPYHGFVRRRSIVITFHQPDAPAEDRFFTRFAQANVSNAVSNKAELEEFSETLVGLYKRIVNDQQYLLTELVSEYIQDFTEKWFLIRVVSYEVSKKLKLLMPVLVPLKNNKRNWNVRNPRQYNHLTIKRMSQTILSIKQALGISITSGDRERVAGYTDFTKKLKKQRTSLPQLKPRKLKAGDSLQEDSYSGPDHKPKTSLDMSPLFEFPTPKDNEDLLNRTTDSARAKITEIKDFIKRQNNSMFMRIHYQDELPEERKLKEYVKQTVGSVAEDFDRLRVRGIEGRAVLKTHQSDVYRQYQY